MSIQLDTHISQVFCDRLKLQLNLYEPLFYLLELSCFFVKNMIMLRIGVLNYDIGDVLLITYMFITYAFIINGLYISCYMW